MLRALIIIIAVVVGLALGGLIGFFLPLLLSFAFFDTAAGGAASASWVFAIITIPLFALVGGVLLGMQAVKKTEHFSTGTTS